jgi:dTDP-4-dehydrorhamnose 3,5-epimerase
VSERFDILETTIPGVKVVQRRPIQDTRGFFERLFCASEMSALTNSKPVLQVNRTRTLRPGAVRGMHFQYPPHCERKFVACVRGEVYDVAVDIRRGSKTFLQWHAEILTDSNFKTLFIPEGFAHGFQSLTADCELLYLHTAEYVMAAEGALNARDPILGIRWPMLISEMSERDRQHPLLSSTYEGVDS